VTATSTFNGQFSGPNDFGQTDGSGAFSLTGTFSAGSVGNWVEDWYVGGVHANPTLYFAVSQPPTCTGYAAPAPPVMYRVDYYDGTSELPYAQSLGYGAVEAEIVSGNCGWVGTTFAPEGYPDMIRAVPVAFSPNFAAWSAWDNGAEGAYGFLVRCYDCLYPVVQYADFQFIAVDNYGNA